jgi:hypothetical protein
MEWCYGIQVKKRYPLRYINYVLRTHCDPMKASADPLPRDVEIIRPFVETFQTFLLEFLDPVVDMSTFRGIMTSVFSQCSRRRRWWFYRPTRVLWWAHVGLAFVPVRFSQRYGSRSGTDATSLENQDLVSVRLQCLRETKYLYEIGLSEYKRSEDLYPLFEDNGICLPWQRRTPPAI